MCVVEGERVCVEWVGRHYYPVCVCVGEGGSEKGSVGGMDVRVLPPPLKRPSIGVKRDLVSVSKET